MKKLVFLVSSLFLLGSGVACYGKTVDENTAKTIGSNFLRSNDVPGINGSSDLVTTYVAKAEVNGATIVDYYVFNFTSGNGFIIVSADDNIIPVLAYSAESIFDINRMAPATKDWVEGYKNEITYAITNNLPANTGTSARWSDLATVKEHAAARTTATFPSSTVHLVQTTWDQEPGYNNYCPSAAGVKAPTGCVATAMAQIMKFWNWPTVGCGAHTYTPNPNPAGYGGQSADFGNTAYNWTSMNGSLTAPNYAIDTLMYHAGVAVEMGYAADESGAYVTESETPPPYVSSAEYALKTYFHYKTSMHSALRSGNTYASYASFYTPVQAAYSETAWISLVEAELNAGHPMLYKGQGSDGGHVWVCDGYESTNMMHFNWGWSGASNGYYTVDNLAPPALGTGGGAGNFNTDQGVLMGIVPDSFLTASGNIKMASHVDCPNLDAYPYNSAISVIAKVTNSNTTNFTGSFSAQAYDTFNHYVATIATLTGQSLAAGATSASALIFTASAGVRAMIPGQYNIRIMYQATGTTSWTPVNNNGTFINDNKLDVRLTGMTNSALELYAPINVTTGTSLLVGGAITLNTKVINFHKNFYYPAGANYSGAIQATLINVTTGASFIVQSFPTESILDEASKSYSFTNSHVTAVDGEYVLAVQYEPTGGSSFSNIGADYYVNPVIIHIHTNVGVNTVSNADNIAVYPNPASDVVNIITQDVTVDHLIISDMQGRTITQMDVSNGQSVIQVPVSNYAAGMYIAQLHIADGSVVTKKIVITK